MYFRRISGIWVVTMCLCVMEAGSMCTNSVPKSFRDRLSQLEREIERRVDLGYNRDVLIICKNGHEEPLVHASSINGGLPQKIDMSSLWEIGSISKLFTAHLTLILQEEGSLSIDEPIGCYIPQDLQLSQDITQQVTLRHLLSHSSGITDPGEGNYYNEKNGNTVPIADFSREQFFDYLSHLSCKYPPGTMIEYSNSGYALVGYILEYCGGKDYFALLKEKILSVLGMDDTYLEVPLEEKKRLLLGHSYKGTAPYWQICDLPFYGGLKSSGRDLLKYLDFFFFRETTSKVLGELLQPQLEWDREPIIATLSWTIDKRYGGWLYAMTGKTLGFSTFMGYCPTKKEGLIILTNEDVLDTIGHHFFNCRFPLTTLYEAIPVAEKQLTQWDGIYVNLVNDLRIQVKSKGGQLQFHMPDEQPVVLLPLGDNKFFIRRLDFDASPVQFQTDSLKKRSFCIQEKKTSLLFQEENDS